jgi:hypothetical protein
MKHPRTSQYNEASANQPIQVLKYETSQDVGSSGGGPEDHRGTPTKGLGRGEGGRSGFGCERPLQASTRCSKSLGWTRLMAASRAQWLWPRRQEKSKEDRPPVASRPQKSRTTSGAKTPRTPPSSTAGCASRSSWAGPRAPARRRKMRRIRPSTASTGRRHLPPSRGGMASMMQATPRPKSLSRMTRTMTTRAAGGPAARQGPPKGAAAPMTRPTGPMMGTDRPRRPPRAGTASQRTPPLAGAASPCMLLAGAASLRGPPARTRAVLPLSPRPQEGLRSRQ